MRLCTQRRPFWNTERAEREASNHRRFIMRLCLVGFREKTPNDTMPTAGRISRSDGRICTLREPDRGLHPRRSKVQGHAAGGWEILLPGMEPFTAALEHRQRKEKRDA